jgi:hypothetical protein
MDLALAAGIALHSLKTYPDIGLDVLHHVADVEGCVSVGQGGGDEQLAGHGRIALFGKYWKKSKAFYQRLRA